MFESRVRRDGAIRIPNEIQDALKIYPQTKVELTVEDGALVIRKIAAAEDPFAAAAKGPDLDAIEKMRDKYEKDKERAKDRFEELLKNPPEIKPEDNPDLWR
jgi:bifunctional DNA-binding transcriptional regulator/antitoxin component of YhaV-PrlF toxin-antitoxin module